MYYLSLKSRPVTEKFSDVKYDQSSFVLSQLPRSRAIVSALRFDTGTRHQAGIEREDMLESQDKLSNTDNDLDVQVHMDRSIVVDIRTEEKSKGHKDLDPV